MNKAGQQARPMTRDEIVAKTQQVVAIPGWEPGEVFHVKLKRASLLNMASSGQIPNELLPIVHKIIEKGEKFDPQKDFSTEEFLNFIRLLDAAAKAVMVEPTFDEVSDMLLDEQKLAIFFYAQRGLKALEFFRRKQDALIADLGNV